MRPQAAAPFGQKLFGPGFYAMCHTIGVVPSSNTISIVIPAYNEAHYLTQCLESIAEQTVLPDEVIVVDNGSSDNTVEVAKRYPFVTVVTKKRRGIVYARNAGFDAARSDIIGRIDADTILPSNWVEYVLSYFATACSGETAWTGAPLFYNVRLPRFISLVYSGLAFGLNHLLTGFPTLWGSNMAIRRAHWEQVRTMVHTRTDIHEDLDLAYHLRDAGVRVVYDKKIKNKAMLRRVRSGRHELWDYLNWWPRTLRIHGAKTWVICWLIGVVMLYPATPLLGVFEFAARLAGRKPLRD